MSLGLIPQISNTAALRYFYEVAQHGSFRAASEKIDIAASAIHRQIHLLETELGAELFERGRGRAGCRLTTAGEALMYRLRLAMRELATARAEIDALQGLHRGRIALGVNDTLGREFAVDFMAEFCATHPGVTFDVRTANSPQLLELLLRDEVDIIIASGLTPRRELEVLASSATRIFVMLRDDHPLAHAASIDLPWLAEQRLMLPDADIGLRQVVDGMLARAGLVSAPVVTTNSFELMGDMVRAGIGIGLQARLSAGADRLRAGLRYVPLLGAPPRASVIACAIRTGRSPSAAMTECLRRATLALSAWFDSAREG
ncbi:LysR family transcriptional regulator [Humitalea sp. 24SJ18S-53]|uniref:LysR family transcriptional regulator n=1 Tax=Humitalea sp. 24SJ18S-53 TaxID=3422307 RepID=UPI003D66FFAD